MKKLNRVSSILFILSLLVVIPSLFPAFATQSMSCTICGMEVKLEAKTSYESKRGGKSVRFCSFSCAQAFHKKFPSEKLLVKDYENAKDLDSRLAYFLVGSENILKEIEFGMPPAIVAFEKEESAKRAQGRLKDGMVVQGFEAVEKKYE